MRAMDHLGPGVSKSSNLSDSMSGMIANECQWTRRHALRAMAAWGAAPLLAGAARESRSEVVENASSPYKLAFTHSVEELIGDLEHTERGDPRHESETPHAHWYSADTSRRFHAWGPKPRHYPPLANLHQASATWKRERVIATAARFLGYGYQHHHIPDWNPPSGWPWKETCVGHNGKGVDCSNLTSFVYNQGFGIRMTSAVVAQAEFDRALEGHHELITVRAVELPSAFDARERALRTGDLVYIRGREEGPITHVVIWVGSVGRSPSGVPLVIDSHGAGVEDDNGRSISCGVQLRPFREHSWYNRCATHAHRIFHD
jgi:cell wall-associated NlpC family hydrolase